MLKTDLDYKAIVQQQLAKFLPQNTSLSEAITYSVENQGKRFRANLCYITAAVFNININLVHSSSCALELIHSYSLIHDDLPAMDNDDTRHNQPTNHKKFDEATAILAGDSIQTLAFKILANDNNLSSDIKIELIKILTNASWHMAQGQKLDIDGANNLEELQNIHQLKTGALISASVQMGAVLSGVSVGNLQILTTFGNKIGLAYQMQDDVLDYSPIEIIGKSSNSDVNNNKNTFVSFLGIEKTKNNYQQLYNSALQDISQINVNTKELQELIKIIINRGF